MSDGPELRLLRWQDARCWAAPLRQAVFVEEQGVPIELEWDDKDDISIHAIVIVSDFCVGTARLFHTEKSESAGLGRMAVRKDWRERGVGSLLMKGLLDVAVRDHAREIILHAQIAAAGFYLRYGFVANGREFTEAGIPHVEMRLSLDPILKQQSISPSMSPLR